MNFRECATSWQDSVAILRKPATQVGFRSRVRKLNEYLGDVPMAATPAPRFRFLLSRASERRAPKGYAQ